MFWLSLFRIIALAWASFCAIILLGVGAHALSTVGDLRLPTFAWAGLAVATAVLSIISIPAMLVIDFIRSGAFTSMIVVELAWLGFLGVLMLATGGAAAANAADFWVDCSDWSPASARTVCNETSAASAFGFLGWLALWAYTGTLLVMLIIHATRGNYIWQQTVKTANFQAGGGGSIPPIQTGEAKPYEVAALNPGQVPYGYPPASTMQSQPTGGSMPMHAQV